MLFASGGHRVRLYDVIPEAIQAATIQIKTQLETLEKNGQLKNSDKLNAEQQFNLISGNFKDLFRTYLVLKMNQYILYISSTLFCIVLSFDGKKTFYPMNVNNNKIVKQTI